MMLFIVFILALIFTFCIPPLGLIFWIIFVIGLVLCILKSISKGIFKGGLGIFKIATNTRCPFCKSKIRRGALVCPVCGRDIVKTNSKISANTIDDLNVEMIEDSKININKIYLSILEYNKKIVCFFRLDKIKNKLTIKNEFFNKVRENPVIEFAILEIAVVLLMISIFFRNSVLKDYNKMWKILDNDISIEDNVITNNSDYTIKDFEYSTFDGNVVNSFTIQTLNPGESYTINNSNGYDVHISNSINPTLIKKNYFYILIGIVLILLIIFKILFIDDYSYIEKLRSKIKYMEEFNSKENIE